jgi:hypothetical protein
MNWCGCRRAEPGGVAFVERVVVDVVGVGPGIDDSHVFASFQISGGGARWSLGCRAPC